MNINLGCLGTHIISIKIQRFPGTNVFTLLFITFFAFRHYFLVKFFLLVSRRSLKKHIPKILLYKQDQDLQKSSSVTGKNILATLSMFLYIYPVRLCVCVFVCVFILFHLLISFGCTTSVTYVRSSDQRSLLVSISRAFYQVPSSLFLNLSYFTSKDENSSRPLTGEKAIWYNVCPRKDDIYWYRI